MPVPTAATNQSNGVPAFPPGLQPTTERDNAMPHPPGLSPVTSNGPVQFPPGLPAPPFQPLNGGPVYPNGMVASGHAMPPHQPYMAYPGHPQPPYAYNSGPNMYMPAYPPQGYAFPPQSYQHSPLVVYQTGHNPPPGLRPQPPPHFQPPPNQAVNGAGPPPTQANAPPSSSHDASLHPEWRGRLAPLPGFSSPPGLGPPKTRVRIKSARSKSNLTPSRELPKPVPVNDAIGSPTIARPVSSDTANISGSSPPSIISSPSRELPKPVTISPAREVGKRDGCPKPVPVLRKNSIASQQQREISATPSTSNQSLSPGPTLNGVSSSTTTPPNPSDANASKSIDIQFAETFIPQYLKDVQVARHRMAPLPPAADFPERSYLGTFLPQKLINDIKSSKSTFAPLLHSYPYSEDESSVPAVSPEAYAARWRALLLLELDQVADDKGAVVLWDTGVSIYNYDDAEFVVRVSGIRENYPKLDLGDVLHMRETPKLEANALMAFQAFEGRITALRKREGLVHFVCPALKTHIGQHNPYAQHDRSWFNSTTRGQAIPHSFNFTFLASARAHCDMDEAAQVLQMHLDKSRETRTSGVARRWLFPTHADLGAVCLVDGKGTGTGEETIEEEGWVDGGLNEEQKDAVISCALWHWPVPYLISGPPGTGKTRTIVETVLQILRLQPNANILLCAPSNPATDILVLRLRAHLKPGEMLRLNDESRSFAEVPSSITQYSYVEDNRFSIPPWETLMAYRVVVCSCLDASILVRAHCTNTVLEKLERFMMKGFYPKIKKRKMVQPHWTHLLIDEAAQGLESELAIPISVVLPSLDQPERNEEEMDFSEGLSSPQLVLCGDPNQLGAFVSSEAAIDASFNMSLLERLFLRLVYADHERSRSNMLKNNFVQSERSGAVPFVNLVRNYRSHPVILMPPSAMFYDDTLEPYAENGSINWSGLPNPDLPLKFIGHEELEDCTDERVNFFNLGDIRRIVETCKSLMEDGKESDPPLQASSIGVIAPWREQVWKIRENLRKEGLADVDVGTVEDYQGRENRVIILSCVRAHPRFLQEDQQKGIGLVFERKRMNVAITRAKELLVVIGNGSFLKRDPYWRSFLQFTLRNKLYEGPNLHLPVDVDCISRLESEFMSTVETGIELDEEEHILRMAGDMARELLKD